MITVFKAPKGVSEILRASCTLRCFTETAQASAGVRTLHWDYSRESQCLEEEILSGGPVRIAKAMNGWDLTSHSFEAIRHNLGQRQACASPPSPLHGYGLNFDLWTIQASPRSQWLVLS